MLNKKKENSFRIILPTKMAEIFDFKIWKKLFQSLVHLAATTLRRHHRKPNWKRIAVWLADHFKTILIVLAHKMAEIMNF